MFTTSYLGKRVLITGDTGFKGSWLALWLLNLGADVFGYSLKPNTSPSHFSILKSKYKTYFGDICDLQLLQNVIEETSPEIIFHLAAQPLVRYSYNNPLETFQHNVIGTANVLEASRFSKSVKAIIVITTDKCYENNEGGYGFVETDRLGGYDPYSSSKACAELVTNTYRSSYFNLSDYDKRHEVLIATARAGNVIGGGDWSKDRLIPDIIRSIVNSSPLIIRSPNSTRPWQHVLEPLRGYLMLGEKLLNREVSFSGAWNFGPEENNILTVRELLSLSENRWNKFTYFIEENSDDFHEAKNLILNINKVKKELKWQPIWSNETAIGRTIDWYREFYENGVLNTERDIKEYVRALNIDL
ncbi:CDP-glucose 4,6-dehydratase [bacterium]|nr:CDP-glucose 4,6-dehydratase [bacterium]